MYRLIGELDTLIDNMDVLEKQRTKIIASAIEAMKNLQDTMGKVKVAVEVGAMQPLMDHQESLQKDKRALDAMEEQKNALVQMYRVLKDAARVVPDSEKPEPAKAV